MELQLKVALLAITFLYTTQALSSTAPASTQQGPSDSKTNDDSDMCPSVYLTDSIPFQDTSKGEMNVVEYTCGMPPQRRYMSRSEYVYYIPVGSKVRLRCEIYNNSGCVPGSLYLSENSNLSVHTQVVNDRHTLFTIDFAHLSLRRYSLCHCNQTDPDEDNVIGLFFLSNVGYKPTELVGFQCVIWDFKEAHCSWEVQKGESINWTSCYALRSEIGKEMLNYGNLTCHTDQSYEFVIPSSDYVHSAGYVLNISGSNAYGTSNTTYEYTPHLEVLSAPEVQRVEPGGRTVSLQWNQQCNSNPVYAQKCIDNGLLYKISLTVIEEATPDYYNIESYDRVVTEIGTFQPTNSSINASQVIHMSYVMPYTSYRLHIQQVISGSMNGSMQWSNAKELTFKTAEVAPSRGPFINQNGFSFSTKPCPTEEQHSVVIYWQRLEVHSGGNGAITAYSVEGTNTSAQHREVSVCIPKRQTELSIFAANSKGMGNVSTPLVIPSAVNMMNLSTCLVRVYKSIYETLAVTVNWALLVDYLKSQDITNVVYTVFWCKEVKGLCQEEFDWLELEKDDDVTEHTLTMESDRTNYKFGIGVVYGTHLSGILWAACLLGTAAPADSDVTFKATQYNDTHVQVEAIPQCQAGMRMIESLDISYYKSGSSISQAEASIPAFCKQVIYIQLDANIEYTITLTVTYADEASYTKALQITLISAKGDRNLIIICSLIAGGIVFGVVIAFIVYYIHRKRQTFQKMTVRTVAPVLITENIENCDIVDREESYFWIGLSDVTFGRNNLELRSQSYIESITESLDMLPQVTEGSGSDYYTDTSGLEEAPLYPALDNETITSDSQFDDSSGQNGSSNDDYCVNNRRKSSNQKPIQSTINSGYISIPKAEVNAPAVKDVTSNDITC